MPEIQTFKPVTCKHFNVLRSRSNANKKVIDTQCTCVLFSPVFADQNPPPDAPALTIFYFHFSILRAPLSYLDLCPFPRLSREESTLMKSP